MESVSKMINSKTINSAAFFFFFSTDGLTFLRRGCKTTRDGLDGILGNVSRPDKLRGHGRPALTARDESHTFTGSAAGVLHSDGPNMTGRPSVKWRACGGKG